MSEEAWKELAQETMKDVQVISCASNFISKDWMIKSGHAQEADAIQIVRDQCESTMTRFRSFVKSNEQAK